MKNIDIKKILSQVRLPKRTEFRTISAKAHHDWKWMVLTFIVFSCFAIAGNVYLFWQINTGSFSPEASVTTPPSDVVSQKNLEDTVTFFKNRQARLQDLQTNKPNALDPSF